MKHTNVRPKPSAKASVGLRTVAVFEAAKGGIVLLLGCGLLDLIHRNLGAIAGRLADVLHVNPDGKLSNVFVKLASHATDRLLWMLAIGALVYAAVRAVEAYGLWREREWGTMVRTVIDYRVFATRVVLAATSSNLAERRCPHY